MSSLRAILDKMENEDPDFRYMATADLMSHLQQQNSQTDTDTQKKLCRALIKLLKDSSSEVQGMAMKCLAPLARFVDDLFAVYLVEKLLEPVVRGQDDKTSSRYSDVIGIKSMRDIAFLGLKSIVAELAPNQEKSAIIAKSNVPKVLQSIAVADKTTDSHIEALELLNEFVSRMGDAFPESHNAVRQASFKQLDSVRPVVRKRAITCIASLGAVCDGPTFALIMQEAIGHLEKSGSEESTRTGVQVIWGLSKTSGYLLGSYLSKIAPILFEFCSSEKYEHDDELREQCMQALESFCIRCRREMVPYVENLAKCSVELAKYDPNYAHEESDVEEEENGMEEDDEDYGDGEFDDDDYSDDDDASWKVRRAAIRCIHAIIRSHLQPLDELYSNFALFLVSRFKEREENVKLDVFAAFISLLRLRSGSQPGTEMITSTESSESATQLPSPTSMAVDMDIGTSSELAPLLERAAQIVRSVQKELMNRSIKTRIKAMAILREMVATAPHTVAPLVGKVMGEVEQCLADDSTPLKSESLLLLRGIVQGDGAPAMKDYIQGLIPKIVAAADDRYYKITAESLRLCRSCVQAFGRSSSDCKDILAPLAPSIYDAAEERIKASDQDSEVKEAALQCIGATVSFYGENLGAARLSASGSTLCDRLNNEVTRLAAVRALHQIALSSKKDVLLPVTGVMTEVVGGFLRKNNPSLRIASLELLPVAPSLAEEHDIMLVSNTSEMISDVDLRLASLAMRLAACLVSARGSRICSELAKPDGVYERALKLAVSPLLQGRAVDSLVDFLTSLARANSVPLTVEQMVTDLRELTSSLDKSSVIVATRASPLNSIAKCFAVVCAGASSDFLSAIASELIINIESQDLKLRVFSLACLGEFGRRSLIQNLGDLKVRVQESIVRVLDCPAIEVKTAAALALGGVFSSHGQNGLAELLSFVKKMPQYRYLLLLSLKDALSHTRLDFVTDSVPAVLPLLLESIPLRSYSNSGGAGDHQSPRVSSGEESVRIAAAECLGLLAQYVPAQVIPELQKAAQSDNAEVRATVASALRFGISTSPKTSPVAPSSLFLALKQTVANFFGLIDDANVSVSKNALQAINAMARSQPSLLIPYLKDILPLIYKRTVKDVDLVRVVDLGPFRHEEDFGLDLRKSAFDCMRTLISGPLCHLIPLAHFVEKVANGLRDQADVRAIAQLILATAAASPYAPQMVNVIEQVVKALTDTLNERIKENAVRQEIERHEDSIRGALRAVRMMEKVPEIASNRTFNTFLTNVVQQSRFIEKYKALSGEAEMMSMSTVMDLDGVSLVNTDDQMRD